jgi:CelD/BcsL family acetyltransferase involved in cellulose biosynthesis
VSVTTEIDFTVGSRRVFSARREVARWNFDLETILSDNHTAPVPPAPGPDGLEVISAPRPAVPAILARFPEHLVGGRVEFRRHYVDMGMGLEAYMARFSSKTRSTLRRKARKLAREAGDYRISAFRTAEEVAAFLERALPLSRATYQARLLDAGLPEALEERRGMIASAGEDGWRCFLLEAAGRPLAYLALEVRGRTLVYTHVGHDPAFEALSPGTVLQLEALEHLFDEGRFAWFDFTEGEGAHKERFGTACAECSSFLLLEPTLANRSLTRGREAFDAAVAAARMTAGRLGLLAKVRSLLRA